MRKIIFSIPITLDGFIEGPKRELDWVNATDELHDFYTQLLQSGDLLIYGRVAYELMVNYWPTATSDPQANESEKRFANALNPMRKIVYSRSMSSANWNTQVKHTFDPEDIMRLKAQPGANILLSGGATLAQAFFENGLVDEYLPVIQPVAIGHGRPLFGNLRESRKLNFQWSRRVGSNTVALCYRMNGKG